MSDKKYFRLMKKYEGKKEALKWAKKNGYIVVDGKLVKTVTTKSKPIKKSEPTKLNPLFSEFLDLIMSTTGN